MPSSVGTNISGHGATTSRGVAKGSKSTGNVLDGTGDTCFPSHLPVRVSARQGLAPLTTFLPTSIRRRPARALPWSVCLPACGLQEGEMGSRIWHWADLVQVIASVGRASKAKGGLDFRARPGTTLPSPSLLGPGPGFGKVVADRGCRQGREVGAPSPHAIPSTCDALIEAAGLCPPAQCFGYCAGAVRPAWPSRAWKEIGDT